MTADPYRHTKAQWPITSAEACDRYNASIAFRKNGSVLSDMIVFPVAFAALWLIAFLAGHRDILGLMTALLFPVLFLCWLVSAWVGRWTRHRALRAYDLICPTCGKDITPLFQSVFSLIKQRWEITSPRCPKCGTTLIAEATTPEEKPQL